MYPLPLNDNEWVAYRAELRSSLRVVRCRAQVFTNNDKGTGWDLPLINGEVVNEVPDDRSSPVATAHLEVLDLTGKIRIGPGSVAGQRRIWFNKRIRVTYDVWVPALGRWVICPIFHGPITNVSSNKWVVSIDCAGKEREHLAPYFLTSPKSYQKHYREYKMIRDVFLSRGETSFRFQKPGSRLARSMTFPIGSEAWKNGWARAHALDLQLFYRANGDLVLRPHPKKVAWTFKVGDDAMLISDPPDVENIDSLIQMVIVRGEKTVEDHIVKVTKLTAATALSDTDIHVQSADGFQAKRKVEIGIYSSDPVIRSVAGSYTSGTTIPLSYKVGKVFPIGTAVRISYKGKVAKSVWGRAGLRSANSLSSSSLSDGNRPRVMLVEAAGIHKKDKADAKAKNLLQRKGGQISESVGLETLVIPFLEPMDLVRVNLGGVLRTVVLKQFTIPLVPEETMQINWGTERDAPPTPRHHLLRPNPKEFPPKRRRRH